MVAALIVRAIFDRRRPVFVPDDQRGGGAPDRVGATRPSASSTRAARSGRL